MQLVDGLPVFYGIPFTLVDTSPAKRQQFPRQPTVFTAYASESDNGACAFAARRARARMLHPQPRAHARRRRAGTYPFPLDAPIEGAYPGCNPATCRGDRHVLALDNATCLLHEGFDCRAPRSNAGAWTCSNGAFFNMSNPRLPSRPLGWTSADAAGARLRTHSLACMHCMHQTVPPCPRRPADLSRPCQGGRDTGGCNQGAPMSLAQGLAALVHLSCATAHAHAR